MKTIIPMVSILALALAAPMAAEAQDNGRGNGKGNAAGQAARGGPDRGPDAERGRPDTPRATGQAKRAEAQDRPGRAVEREIGRFETRVDRDVRDVRDVRDLPGSVRVRPGERGLIAGCPPGLARKDNGCLPPGQARKAARLSTRYDYLWNRGDPGARYRYEDGYLYRTDASGSLLGYLPMLGGALSPGATWPAQYQYQPAPSYLTRYLGLGDRYSYRTADGVLYGVDPKTQAIGQVAALLTGQSFNVGQAMPAGYDVYNVPYDYRGQYVDSPERMYRYNDGQIYQVDPTTRIVQAVIQMLT